MRRRFSARKFSDLSQGIYNNILFMATGVLMSPTTCGQGAAIPSIAHLVVKNR